MKYLVAIDSSLNASACVETLCKTPVPEGSQIHVISVWDDAPIFIPDRMMRQQAESLVAESLSQLKVLFGDAVTGEAVPGNAIARILQAIESLVIDTTLIGAHSRRAWRDILLGNVAKEVLRRAKSSVTVVRVNAEGNFVMPKRHLVCLDASPLAESTMRSLENRGWAPGSELRILHVLEPDLSTESEDPKRDAELCCSRLNERRQAMQSLIDSHIAAMKRSCPELVVKGQILEEIDAVEGILVTAKSWKSDLIIMGSHGRTGFDRVWLGSVSEDVSARATCAVEIVR